MTAYQISVEPQVHPLDAIKLTVERDFGNLVISNEIIPKDILTEREIIRAVAESRNLDEITISDIGHQAFTRLEFVDTVLDAVHIMKKTKSRTLPYKIWRDETLKSDKRVAH